MKTTSSLLSRRTAAHASDRRRRRARRGIRGALRLSVLADPRVGADVDGEPGTRHRRRRRPSCCPFYDQTLSWAACGGFDCTTVTAPLDWADPDAGEIELSVIRQRALSGDADRISADQSRGPRLERCRTHPRQRRLRRRRGAAEQFDVIGFDPRGVGESTAVRASTTPTWIPTCSTSPPTRGDRRGGPPSSRSANQEFSDACEANSDGILPFITTENSARDMDLLRAVLGDTRAELPRLLVRHVPGRHVREALPRPGGPPRPRRGDRPGRVGRRREHDAGDRLRVGTARLHGRLPGGLGLPVPRQRRRGHGRPRHDARERRPVAAPGGRRPACSGADSLLTGIVAALYAEESWPFLSAALSDVLQGDPEIAFQLADFYYNREAGRVPRQLHRGLPCVQLHGLPGRHDG